MSSRLPAVASRQFPQHEKNARQSRAPVLAEG